MSEMSNIWLRTMKMPEPPKKYEKDHRMELSIEMPEEETLTEENSNV